SGQKLSEINAICEENKLDTLSQNYKLGDKAVYSGCRQPYPLIIKKGKFVSFQSTEEADQDKCVMNGYKRNSNSFLQCISLAQQQRQADALQAELANIQLQNALNNIQQQENMRVQQQIMLNNSMRSNTTTTNCHLMGDFMRCSSF
ncbi:hypothetical protein EBS02_11070, partial [bacterium]|nr:hypothetical protein [bacterium]